MQLSNASVLMRRIIHNFRVNMQLSSARKISCKNRNSSDDYLHGLPTSMMCRTTRRTELVVNSSQKLRLRCNSRQEGAIQPVVVHQQSAYSMGIKEYGPSCDPQESRGTRSHCSISQLSKRSDCFDFHRRILLKSF